MAQKADSPALDIIHHRRGLQRAWRAIREGRLTLGFLGGSITDGRGVNNWPEPVIAWFVRTFPGVRIGVENAGIGATGSESAVFRVERDILERGCDLVFIEYAVNDNGQPTVARQRTREGLIRKCLDGAGRDVVLVYTYAQDMYADMIQGRVPASIAEFERLGEHYGLGSVWMGLHALREVQAGQMRWEEWLPDGLHPQHRGSLSYGQSVIACLERELPATPGGSSIPAGADMPAPLDPLNWQHAACLPFDAVTLDGPWTIRRSFTLGLSQALDTAAVGARLSFAFEGRAISLGLDHGKTSADFRYCLDGGEWLTMKLDRPVWCGPSGWYMFKTLADDLPRGRHTLALEVIHANTPEAAGTNFRLGCIGIVP